jgi:translation initiation factor IF-2
MTQNLTNKGKAVRPPVVCILGHVDHGKSTLLDYIRKTKLVEKEAGGITQHIGAYEVSAEKTDKKQIKITFIDTPGHEAFGSVRSRGASVADIAILVVSGEDGVMPQTLDAFSCIKGAKIPFIVAITKIDKPNADVERTKQSLAEKEIYLEGYGGDIPWVALSGKTGEGINELLELIGIVAEMNEIKEDENSKNIGFVIESHLDKNRGAVGSIIVKNGKLKQGDVIISKDAFATVRLMENDLGKSIKEAEPSMPIRITGWSKVPSVGEPIILCKNKKEAEEIISKDEEKQRSNKKEKVVATDENNDNETKINTIPCIIKADATSTLEAIAHELKKIESERIKVKIISEGVGDICEKDAKLAHSTEGTVIVGFNVKIDNRAKTLAERDSIIIKTFDIIYKLSEWLEEEGKNRTPKMKVEERTGSAKIQKCFSKEKDRQVVGGKVIEGEITSGAEVKIMRRDSEIGRGKIRELQKQKQRTDSVSKDNEFGTLIEAKITIMPGDFIECFKIVEK